MSETKFPDTIGKCIDLLYEMRAERLAIQKTVNTAKASEAKLEAHIIDTFGKSEIDGAKGHTATAALRTDTVVNLVDWDAFIGWAALPENRDCIHRQPGSTAVKARWAAEKQVPGVEPFRKVSLSLTKS